VVTPVTPPVRVFVAKSLVPSLNTTVPVGVPPPPLTVAGETDWLAIDSAVGRGGEGSSGDWDGCRGPGIEGDIVVADVHDGIGFHYFQPADEVGEDGVVVEAE